jgi:hypothetical protein
MRSRTAWTILVLVVVLIVIALMRFNLAALREPGSLATSVVNWGTHFRPNNPTIRCDLSMC